MVSTLGKFALALLAALAIGAVSVPVQAQSSAVTIQSFAFHPGTMQVPVGATVTWTNQDSTPHTATSDTNAFDSGTLVNGGSYHFTFTQPGTYAYHCAIHPFMTGEIIVGGTPGVIPPTPTPVPTSPPVRKLRVTVKGTLHRGAQGTLNVTVKDTGGRAVKAARVSANLHGVGIAKTIKANTNARGQAKLSVNPARTGSIPIKATKSGFTTKTVKVQVRA